MTDESSYPGPVGFIHVPKCAGTSIFAAARDSLGADEVYQHGVEAPYAMFEANAEMLAKKRFIGGHLTLEEMDLVPGERKLFLVIRQPIERVISYANFVARRPKNVLYDSIAQSDYHTFLERCLEILRTARTPRRLTVNAQEVENGICRRLGCRNAAEALELISARKIKVFFQEHLDPSALAGFLGIQQFEIPQMNRARGKFPIRSSEWMRIWELNREDMLLYEELLRRSQAQS
ncbi:MAG: hypothetical protein AAGA23_07290 [Pseudomonadota bacterium]